MDGPKGQQTSDREAASPRGCSRTDTVVWQPVKQFLAANRSVWGALAVLCGGWAVAAWADPPLARQPAALPYTTASDATAPNGALPNATALRMAPTNQPPANALSANRIPAVPGAASSVQRATATLPLQPAPVQSLPAQSLPVQAVPVPAALPASPLDPLPAPAALPPQATWPTHTGWARPLRDTAAPGAAVDAAPLGTTPTSGAAPAEQPVLYNAPADWRGETGGEGWRSAGSSSALAPPQSSTNKVYNSPAAESSINSVQNYSPAAPALGQPAAGLPQTSGDPQRLSERLTPLPATTIEPKPAVGPTLDRDIPNSDIPNSETLGSAAVGSAALDGETLAAADPLAAPQVVDEEGRLPFEVFEHTGEMQIMLRRSKILRTHHDIYRTQVVDPRVCNVVQFTPREVSIIGLAQGATHVTFWYEDGKNRPVTYLIRVTPDVEVQKRREEQYRIFEEILQELFPDSKVYLVPVSDKLIVKGQAKDAEEAAQIMAVIRGQAVMGVGGGGGNFGGGGFGGGWGAGGSLSEGVAAEPFAGQGGNEWGGRALPPSQVINMLRIPGVQQVALKVKIAELNRTRARRFGVDLNMDFADGNVLLKSLLNASSGSIATLTGAFDGDKVNFGLHYLEQEGVIRLLSEPTLVTLSGRPASFVAGGEFAVPTTVGVGGASAVTTDFRSFGAIITFLPIVLDKDRVRLQVSPEFSQINRTLSVNSIPGLTSRAVTTTVEMREGQTLAIAGLLDDSTNASLSGSVPFLYRALGLRQNTKSETELIILVTPELVHPMDPEEVPPLPGFDVTEPTNAQFYLQGKLEGTPTLEYRSTVWPRLRQRYQNGGAAMISGPFGHGR